MGAGGQRPSLPIAWDDLARRAADSMDERAAGYVFGSAGTEDTARENAEAFRRLRIVPRMLRDVSARDLSTTLLGLDLIAPVGLAKYRVAARSSRASIAPAESESEFASA